MSKRVLITGGAGFIAHHLIETILDTTDWTIVSLDRLDFSGNLNRLEDIMKKYTPEQKKRVEIVFHDLRAEVNPQTANLIGDVQLVLHLAAGSHVDRSIEFPMEFVQDNVIGTVNLLQYARTLPNLERFVYFSTDEVFGPAPEGVKYKENDRYNSTNPYSATKAGAEELVVAYENTYKLPAIITHTMNVFGERQHPEKFIPSTIQKARDGEKVIIHADPTRTKAGTRMYIHAKDVAEGLNENASRLLSAEDRNGVITVVVQAPDGTKRSVADKNPRYINNWLMKYGLELPRSITSKFVFDEAGSPSQQAAIAIAKKAKKA